VTFGSNGAFSYTPVAADQGLDSGEAKVITFDYVANDGEASSAPATVTVTVNGVNDAPAFAGDGAITVSEGGTVVVTIADLTASDVDSTNAELVYTLTGAVHGTVLLNGTAASSFTQAELAGNRVSFHHDGGESNGSFTVSLTDGSAAAQTRTVTASVGPHVNDAPSIGPGPATGKVQEDGTAVARGALSAGDPDAGDSALWRLVSGPLSPVNDYLFALDNLFIQRNGANFFTEHFSDGAPPPSTTNSDGGISLATFGSGGGMFQEEGDRLILDEKGAVPTFVVGGTGGAALGHFLTLRSDVLPTSRRD
jgi:VCBS repeat-containing protein